MKITNKYNLPEPFVKSVGNWRPRADGFAVTELINSPRVVRLTRRHFDEIEKDVADMIWVILGNSVHALLQRGRTEGTLTEEKLTAIINGWKVTGKSDLWSEASCDDYKVTSVWTAIYSPEGREEWHAQANVYDWLFERIGFKTETLRIIAILRDWQKRKASDSGYPPIPVTVIDIPKWGFDKTQKYVEERLALHVATADIPDDQLPLCSNEECWMKSTTYAVMKAGRQSAIRVLDTKAEAEEYILEKLTYPAKKSCYTEERKGEHVKCEQGYCDVKPWCNQHREGL